MSKTSILRGLIIMVAALVLWVVVTGREAPHTPAPLAPPATGPGDEAILVIGGNRATGLEIVRLLRARGDEVAVFVRSGSDATAATALGAVILRGDALQPADLERVLASGRFRAVVSTLGRSLQAGPRADDVGNRNAVEAAKQARVGRFVLVTVIGAGDSRDAAYFLARRALGRVMADKTVAENWLKASGIPYTIVRPGGLLAGEPTARAYLTEDVRSFSWIRRTDLARLVVQALDDPHATGKVYHAFDPGRTRFWTVPFN
jgi:uncharacterized protein YbjT (DUF2867 family)